MKNKLLKRLLSFVLSLAIVFGMVPSTVLTASASNDTVYISVSFDGEYQNNVYCTPVKLSDIAQIDLDTYGLGDYKYDADGDGSYETTVLHLYVYAHTQLFGLDWADVPVSGSAGSIFFERGIFGFSDCNLNYYVNGEYPLQAEGWGATADICALKGGDFVDVAGFTSWGFFGDSNSGFKYFTDENGNISHSFTAKQGETFVVNLTKTMQDMTSGSGTLRVPHSSDIYYSKTAFDSSASYVTADSDGKADITFDEAGTWYLWSNGDYGIDMDSSSIVNAPAYATVIVEQSTQPSVIAVESVTLDKDTAELEVGGTTNLTAAVLPENATDKTVEWKSSDETVATVADGLVTAVAAGTATITATSGEKSGTCAVTVKAKNIAVESVTLDKDTAELEVGGTTNLTATVLPENATDKTVEWKSSDETVATVADGLVTAVAAGTATIMATSDEMSDICTVTVTQPQAAEPTVLYVSPGRNTQNWPQTNQYYVAKVTVEGATVDYQETSGSDYHVYFNASTAKDAQITVNVEAGGSKPERLGINFNDDATNTKTYTANLVDGEATVKIYAYKSSGAGASRSGTKTFHFHTATVNNAPVLAQGAVSPDEKTITAGKKLELDLNQIFTDADGDALTYTVSVDGAAARATEAAYSYSNTVAGRYELVFTATDGKTNESEWPEYKLAVVVENATVTYDVTVNMPADVTPAFYANAGYNSDGTAINGKVLTATADNGTYKVSVPENVTAINIVAGGHSLSVNTSETKEYALRKVSLTGADVFDNSVEITSTVKDGSNYAVTGENNVYLLVTGKEYTFTAVPADTEKYKNTDTKLAVATGDDTLNLKLNVSYKNLIKVTAPKGSTVSVGSFGSYFVYSFVEELHKTETEDTVTYYFIAPTGSGQKFYRVQHGEGVTYWNYISSSEADVTVTKDDLYIGSTEFNKKTVYSNFEKNVYDLADIYLNINSKGYMNLAKGEIFELNVFRNWFAIESFVNSKVATPDFNYEIINIEGENVVSVEKNEKNSAVATLTANNEGTAIVLVTYDAMTHMQGQSSGSSKQFSAIWPERTGVFVVSVDKDGTAIASNMTSNGAVFDAEHSPVFYLGDEGASISFKPEDGCTVTVARPTLTANSLNYSTGFVSSNVNVAEDGTVTVSGLINGRNIIKLEKDGVASYQVVTARKVSCTITDVSNNPVTEESVIRPGDSLNLQFTGLTSPAEKLSGVYNFNFAISYTDENGNNFKSNPGSGYGVYDFSGNPARQRITITIPQNCTEGIYTLNGFIQIGGFAAVPIGGHRDVRYATGKPQSFNAESAGIQLGTLPEVKITLIENLRTEAKAEIAAYKNTDDLSESRKAQVADIIAAANAEIENATTALQVENAVNNAKQQLDNVIDSAKLSSLVVYRQVDGKKKPLVAAEGAVLHFSPEKNEYIITQDLRKIEDRNNNKMFFCAVPENDDDTVTLYCAGHEDGVDIKSTADVFKSFAFITGGKNEFKIVVSSQDETVENTTYNFTVYAVPTLANNTTVESAYPVYLTKSLSVNNKTVEITVPSALKEITVNVKPKSENCTVTFNGDTSNKVDITDKDKIEIVVAKDGMSETYTYNLKRVSENFVKINTAPEDAQVKVTVTYKDGAKNYVLSKDVTAADGKYPLIFNGTKIQYSYTVTKDGYTPASGTISNTDEIINVNLTKEIPPQPSEVSDVDWKNFRNSDVNMAITSVKTPKDKVSLKWSTKLGTGWGSAPSVPIVVDNKIVVMSGKKLCMLDAQSGEIVKETEMAAVPNFGYTPPTYANGMIFCPLTNGTVQAFNATTFESLWVYTDPYGGQALSPIAYSDGYIYTGFWNGESGEANYVCIDVTDYDDENDKEPKSAVWTHKQKGGFYWAGAVIVGDAVIVGTDDGDAEGTDAGSYLYSFNKNCGEILSKIALASDAGDQRSSIAYENGAIYFTTKGGYLYSAKVNDDGTITDLKGVNYNAQITSTPVVYKGRVYFGIGSGIRTDGSEGSFVVADAETLEKIFEVEMLGYPQGSALLSTAYEASEGMLYFYMTYNDRPGGISLIKVKTDAQTAADAQLVEIYDAAGFEEFSIASIVCGDDGTLYYKNDSGNFMAVATATAKTVINLIESIGTVTLESEAAIKAAREAYENLDEAEKAKVTNLDVLVAAEKELENFVKADEADKLIQDIGSVTLNNGKRIKAAREAYNKLTEYQKTLVKNYERLLELEKEYNKLATEAVGKVEKLIDKIGDVDIDSADDIADAKLAYNQLPDELKELVDNYDDLKAAEKELKKLREEALELLAEGKLVLTQTELLKLKGDFEKVSENTGYDAVLALLRTFYKLGEKQQLALENSDAVKLAQKIVAKHNHNNAYTGVKVDGLEWNIRLVVEETDNETALNDIKAKLENSDILTIWDIYLEDVLTGKKYKPEEAVQIKIPTALLGDYTVYDYLKVLHITDDGRIELLNCEIADGYIVFNAAEFSWYGVVGFMNGEEETVSDNLTSDAPLLISPQPEVQQNNSNPVVWIVIAAVGIAALAVLVVLKKHTADEE